MDHTRHMNIFDVRDVAVTLIGGGGIGSAAALALAKMGVGYIELDDDDMVDHVNMSTQLHRLSDIGRKKAEAVRDMLHTFSDDTVVDAIHQRITEDYAFNTRIVISAVDSIKARKDIWKAVYNSEPVDWYLDGRMSAEQFQLHTVKLDNWDWYETLIEQEDDSLIEEIPCTMKATIYTAFIAAGVIGKTIRQIVTDITPPRKLIYDIKNDDLILI